jgi:NAD(P)-dependent dehydrogenase (short-subunit alcohol dehydrogenase family)
VNVASEAHKAGSIDFDDLMRDKRYSGFEVYGQSKLANILFTNELARRLAGTRVTANSLHPGAVASNFGRDNGRFGFLFKLAAPFMKTSEQGARTTIFLASSPKVEGVTGKYWKNEREAKPRKVALNAAVAKRLWEVSERLVEKA